MSKKQFAVFNSKKYKNLGGIGSHIDRTRKDPKKKEEYDDDDERRTMEEVGLNIDTTRSHLNKEFVKHGGKSLSTCVNERIQEGYKLDRKIRGDAVKALGLIMTGTNVQMVDITKDKQLFQKWLKENWQFACREFGGKANIVRFTLHMDEKTPHLHCVVVPITADGRLSAAHYVNGKIKLQNLQNKYAESMAPFCLKRGVESKLTGRQHETTQDYYREVNATKQEVEKLTENINNPDPKNFREHKKNVATVNKIITDLKLDNARLSRESTYTQRTFEYIQGNQIKSDLDRIKNEINLIQHAVSMGYRLDKEKSSRTWAVLEKEGDKILIKNGVNQEGNWVFKSLVDDKEKGTIVDFMKNRGFSYQYIRGLGSCHLDISVLQEQRKLSSEVKDEKMGEWIARSAFRKILEHNEGSYLTARGIKEATYANYRESGVRVGNKAVFALYKDIDSQGNGKMCSTISYQFEKKRDEETRAISTYSTKYFQKGLSRGFSVLKDPDVPVKQVVVSESPIDALSYKQIHGPPAGTMYLSTCGSITNDMKEALSHVFAHAKASGQEVVLAFDNDKTGKGYATLLQSYFDQADGEGMAKTVNWSNIEVKVREKVPQGTLEEKLPGEEVLANKGELKVANLVGGKDWNEVLMQQLDRENFAHTRKIQNMLAAGGCEEEEMSKKHTMNVLGMDM